MDVWIPDMILEKKSCQIMLKEMIPGKEEISRLVTIEDGEIIEKPDDVDLLGDLTSEGFVVTGLKIKKSGNGKTKCIMCSEEFDEIELWISTNHPWMKICSKCWEMPFDEKQKVAKEYEKRIFNNVSLRKNWRKQ